MNKIGMVIEIALNSTVSELESQLKENRLGLYNITVCQSAVTLAIRHSFA